MTGKGHSTMLFSREELETIEACLLYCLDRSALDADTAKDAAVIVEEIRIALDKSPKQVADRLTEKLMGGLSPDPEEPYEPTDG